jgi:hypothetical protein
MTDQKRLLVSLAAVKRSIDNADLLLYRRRPLVAGVHGLAEAGPMPLTSRLIACVGRGDHSHAAKAAWWDEDLMALEVREFYGGRAISLASQVARYPGLIDVYAANAGDAVRDYDRQAVVHCMRGWTDRDYGWHNIWRCFWIHAPLVRLWAQTDTDERSYDGSNSHCSMACVLADQAGGAYPVEDCAPWMTEPQDLARSSFYRYRFTLLP